MIRIGTERGNGSMLTRDIADNIVKETMRRLDRNINIMDADGTIIASGDRRRIGERHAGAAEAIRTGRPVAVKPSDDADAGAGKGPLPGVNLPIVFQQRTIGAIGITGDPEYVAEFAELVRMATELMLQQSYLASLAEWRNRAKATVLEEMERPEPDGAKLRDVFELLGVELRDPERVYALRLPAGARDEPQLARELEELWGPKRSLAAPRGQDELCVIAFGLGDDAAASRLERTKAAFARRGAACRIGASGAAAGPEALGALLREAEYALSFATADAAASVVHIAGLEPRMIVSRAPEEAKARFAAQTVAKLSPALRRTLQTFFDCNRSVQGTADALRVHKNTVTYRINKIAEATGRDPQTFADAAALQIALWIAGDAEAGSAKA